MGQGTLELRLLTRIQREESMLGGIGACALPVNVHHQGILVNEDERTETLSFLGGRGGELSGKGTVLTFAVFPDEQKQTNPLPPLQKPNHLLW